MNGNIYLIHPKRYEFFGLVHQIIPLASGAIRGADNVAIDGQADLLIYKQSAIYGDGQIKVDFQLSQGTKLTELPMFISALGGQGGPARILASPFLVPRGSTFTMFADDRQTVAAAQNIRVLHAGVKVFDSPFEPARVYHTVEAFDYVANFTANDSGIGALAANGTLAYPVEIASDHDFEIVKMAILADGDATVQIATTGKALEWFNRACHIALLGGTAFNASPPSGAWPFILPSPVFVPKAGSIQVTAADLSGAANRLQVIFHGRRLKPSGGVPVSGWPSSVRRRFAA